MIKLTFCLHRLPSLTRQEFQDYWLNQHAPLVRRHAATLGVLRYVQTHALSNEALHKVVGGRGTVVEGYDGVCEMWYASEQALLGMGADASVRQAGRELLEDERRFIDLPRSPIFFSRENEIISLAR